MLANVSDDALIFLIFYTKLFIISNLNINAKTQFKKALPHHQVVIYSNFNLETHV